MMFVSRLCESRWDGSCGKGESRRRSLFVCELCVRRSGGLGEKKSLDEKRGERRLRSAASPAEARGVPLRAHLIMHPHNLDFFGGRIFTSARDSPWANSSLALVRVNVTGGKGYVIRCMRTALCLD